VSNSQPDHAGLSALVFNGLGRIEDIYELTYIRKDGSRFPAVVSVTALRDAQDVIMDTCSLAPSLRRGPAERDFQQRQLLEYRHRREGRDSDIQRRRRTNAWLHGR